MLPTIQTSRFILRPFTPSDAEGIFQMDSDPEVHRFLGNRPIESKAQAQAIVDSVLHQYTENGIGRLVIEDKHTGEFIGWSGLKLEKNLRAFEYYDLGYRLRREFWGKGIATEVAIASLKMGFGELRLKEICAAAHVDNLTSSHILTKLGLILREQFIHDGDLCNWYGLQKSEWDNLGF
jgi:[ribosomal protein S5]-alanine N-acetyltransferase